MKTNGRIVKCDRYGCGKEIFCKAIGKGETDGGFTTWSKFEEPEGWSNEIGIGDLCPACTQEYQKLKAEFDRTVENFKNSTSTID